MRFFLANNAQKDAVRLFFHDTVLRHHIYMYKYYHIKAFMSRKKYFLSDRQGNGQPPLRTEKNVLKTGFKYTYLEIISIKSGILPIFCASKRLKCSILCCGLCVFDIITSLYFFQNLFLCNILHNFNCNFSQIQT